MTSKELENLAREQFEVCLAEMALKNLDYSGIEISGDALGGFKQVAERLGVTTLLVWGVYFSKHATAIERFVRGGQLSSETLANRITDAINYLVFLRALGKESGLC